MRGAEWLTRLERMGHPVTHAGLSEPLRPLRRPLRAADLQAIMGGPVVREAVLFDCRGTPRLRGSLAASAREVLAAIVVECEPAARDRGFIQAEFETFVLEASALPSLCLAYAHQAAVAEEEHGVARGTYGTYGRLIGRNRVGPFAIHPRHLRTGLPDLPGLGVVGAAYRAIFANEDRAASEPREHRVIRISADLDDTRRDYADFEAKRLAIRDALGVGVFAPATVLPSLPALAPMPAPDRVDALLAAHARQLRAALAEDPPW